MLQAFGVRGAACVGNAIRAHQDLAAAQEAQADNGNGLLEVENEKLKVKPT